MDDSSKITYISSDEEMIMFRNPKIFPSINKSYMNLDHQIPIKKSLFYDNSNFFESRENYLLKESITDSNYIKYAIIRNQQEESDLNNLQYLIISIKQAHEKKFSKQIKIKKNIKLKILSYINKST